MSELTEKRLSEWNAKAEAAEQLLPAVGRLYRNNRVQLTIFGRTLQNKSVNGIIKAARYARHHNNGVELDLSTAAEIAGVLETLELGESTVDLGRLTAGFQGGNLEEYLRSELADAVGRAGKSPAPRDVVLYGFGRIGRLLARILVQQAGGNGLNLRAIVVRKGSDDDIIKRASLLRRDSVHGKFDGNIVVDEENSTIQANGVLINVIYSSDPASVDYTAYGINDAIVVDNTGRWRDAEGLGQHLQAKGVARVLLTAPGKGEDRKSVV